jgi:hypothetical protein
LRHALSLLILAVSAATASAAEPIGRLFFTPAQRAQLDVARSQKSRAVAEPEQEAPLMPEVVSYDGVVRRSDGKSTVWINSRAINDGKAADKLPVSTRVRPDGSVNLIDPQTRRSVDLKVGQSIDIVSGTVEEPYARRPVADRPAPKSRAANDDGGSAKGSSPALRPDTGKDQDDDSRERR